MGIRRKERKFIFKKLFDQQNESKASYSKKLVKQIIGIFENDSIESHVVEVNPQKYSKEFLDKSDIEYEILCEKSDCHVIRFYR